MISYAYEPAQLWSLTDRWIELTDTVTCNPGRPRNPSSDKSDLRRAHVPRTGIGSIARVVPTFLYEKHSDRVLSELERTLPKPRMAVC